MRNICTIPIGIHYNTIVFLMSVYNGSNGWRPIENSNENLIDIDKEVFRYGETLCDLTREEIDLRLGLMG